MLRSPAARSRRAALSVPGVIVLGRPPVRPRERASEAGAGALGEQVALELRQQCEQPEHELARRSGCVDRHRAVEHSQPDAAAIEILHEADQMVGGASEAIELPDHERGPRT